MSPGVLTRLERWLQQLGFENGHPFATQEADLEGRLLPEFFVDAGPFELIWGSNARERSTLILAPHGGGKSAYRLMVQRQCLPLSDRSDVLGVLYLPDDTLLAKLRNGEPIRTADHIQGVLSQSLRALLDALAGSQDRATGVLRSERSRLASYCRVYLPQALDPGEVLARIRRCEPDFNPPWNLFQRSVREGNLWQAVTDLGLPTSPIIELFADLTQAQPEPIASQLTPGRSFAAFVSLAQACGLRLLCVLVDKWDEIQETAEKPAALALLLEPLLADLHVMETPGAVFKCFLPGAVLEPLKAYGSVRFDRLRICEIRWSDDFLGEVLNRRLVTYSNGRIRSLAQICAAPLTESIDQEIVKWAAGIPRHLLQFGALLFQAHTQETGEPRLLITETSWRQAREAFLADHLPLLLVDPSTPQTYVGKRRIELTPLEYKFLLVLHQRGGWSKKEDLIDRVWGGEEGVTDQAVSRLVRRLREKIEPYPSDPVYLLTEHSAGFRLQHAETYRSPASRLK